MKLLNYAPHIKEIVITENNISILRSSSYFDKKDDYKIPPAFSRNTIHPIENLNRVIGSNDGIGEITPPNCRYYKHLDNGGRLFIIEEPPSIRTIKLNLSLQTEAYNLKKIGKLEKYGLEDFLTNTPPYFIRLSFPYIIYMIKLGDNNDVQIFNVFFRLQPITSLHDYLIRPMLTNIGDNGDVCTGTIKRPQDRDNILELIETYITSWWEYEFNTDLNENYYKYEKEGPSELNGFLSWAYYTKTDPLFIFSVDWLYMESTLGDYIKNIVNHNSLHSNNILNVFEDRLRRMVDPNLSNKHSLIGSVYSDSCVLMRKKVISVGDSIKIEIDGVEYESLYLSNIIYDPDTGGVISFIFETEDYEKVEVKYTPYIENKIYEALKTPNEVLEKDGIIFNIGDIIKINMKHDGMNFMYRKYKGIRRARDGFIEINLGGTYFLENTIDYEKVNLESILVNGITLEKNKEYPIADNSSNNIYFNRHQILKFRDFIVRIGGRIYAEFEHHRDGYVDMRRFELDDMTNSIKVPEFINIENTMEPLIFMTAFDLYSQELDNTYAKISNIFPGSVILKDNINSNYLLTKEYFKNIKDRLFIPGIYNDIDFKIGDKVVVADWDFPEDMLLIQTIKRFEYVERPENTDIGLDKASILYVVCEDIETGQERWYNYVILTYDYNDFVLNGKIRKIEETISDGNILLTSGTLIKAKNAGIAMFPKKDTNAIIGFIVDTMREPLVLCSNLCTQWLNESFFENFDIIPTTHSKYYKDKLKVEPFNINKIKPQIGDLFQRSYGYNITRDTIVSIYSTTPGGCVHRLSRGFNRMHSEYGSFTDKYFGILKPRVTKAILSRLPRNNYLQTPIGYTIIHRRCFSSNQPNDEIVYNIRSDEAINYIQNEIPLLLGLNKDESTELNQDDTTNGKERI